LSKSPLLALALAAHAALATSAAADPLTLRFGAMAPDGSSLAREMRAFGRQVEAITDGRVRVRWHFGAIAGDETRMLERLKRDQLDGAAGAALCIDVAPSLRLLRVVGLVQNRAELAELLSRLAPVAAAEARRNGLELISLAPFGIDVLFSREPIRDLDALKRQRIWIWDLDPLTRVQLGKMGLQPVPLPLDAAASAYEDKRIDAFLAIPTVALTWQWSAQARHVTVLSGGGLAACLAMTQHALDQLAIEDRRAIEEAGQQMSLSFGEESFALSEKLLSGLFARQGLTVAPPSPMLRAALAEIAVDARERLPGELVRPELLERVQGWLADFRADQAR
jgi:TRAP-type C4-dicarboxylate transport system substrate-binding protein